MTLLDVVDCQVVQLRQVPLLGGAIGTALQDEVLLPIGQDGKDVPITVHNLNVKIMCFVIEKVYYLLWLVIMPININNLYFLVAQHLAG